MTATAAKGSGVVDRNYHVPAPLMALGKPPCGLSSTQRHTWYALTCAVLLLAHDCC